MYRFWFTLFFVIAVAALSGTIAAGKAFIGQPGADTAIWLTMWVAALAADGFMLLFQDYRRQKALGNVRTPVPAFERLLRKRGGKGGGA